MSDASRTPSKIEFHSAGYFHPDAVVCSAKQAEALEAELSEARELLREVLNRSTNWQGIPPNDDLAKRIGRELAG